MTAPVALRIVKSVHTVAWAVFAGAIVALPVVAWRGRFDLALVLVALVLFEVLTLAVNGWRCPLTGVAARYTDDRRDNFDVFLPLWLACHNKTIFGVLFVAGLLATGALWVLRG
jgi:hypothetical protein